MLISLRRVREYFEEIVKWFICHFSSRLLNGLFKHGSHSRNIPFLESPVESERFVRRSCAVQGEEEADLVFEELGEWGCASVPLIIRYGHRYRAPRSVIFNLILCYFIVILQLGQRGRRDVVFGELMFVFTCLLEAVVTAWQDDCESLLNWPLGPAACRS